MDTLWRLLSAAMNTAVVSVRYRPRFMLPCVMPAPSYRATIHILPMSPTSRWEWMPLYQKQAGKDLKFINIGQDPLKIVAETNEGTITVSIYLVSKEDRWKQ